MNRAVLRLALVASCAVAFAAPAAEPIPVALLSVATGSATLDLARPETMRPTFVAKPLPYSEEMILKLGDSAVRHALVANERVAAENERNAAIAIQADRDTWRRREDFARHELTKNDFGKAVLGVPEAFSSAMTNGLPFVILQADADGFVPVSPNVLFVRFLFEEPRFNPPPPALPNTSGMPIRAAMPVTLKVEAADGKTVSLGKFEQTAVARNPDILIGPSKRTFMEALVAKAVEAAVAKLPSQIVR